jgi:hypothetical protein
MRIARAKQNRQLDRSVRLVFVAVGPYILAQIEPVVERLLLKLRQNPHEPAPPAGVAGAPIHDQRRRKRVAAIVIEMHRKRHLPQVAPALRAAGRFAYLLHRWKQ